MNEPYRVSVLQFVLEVRPRIEEEYASDRHQHGQVPGIGYDVSASRRVLVQAVAGTLLVTLDFNDPTDQADRDGADPRRLGATADLDVVGA